MLSERIIEEMERYTEYAEWHQIPSSSKVMQELRKLDKFSKSEVRYVMIKSQVKIVFEEINSNESKVAKLEINWSG